MPTVGFHTLGCKLNFSETATLNRQFQRQGFETVPFHQAADVYVINTCSVTENADRKCRKTVKQALRKNPDAYVLVVGCYAQLKPQEIAEIPGVDAVLGAAEKFRIFEFIEDFRKSRQTSVHRCAIEDTHDFVPTYSTEERTRAFLKVQDGCDYKCSFCTIPLARGASRSPQPEMVLEQALALQAAGIQEIVLTGINLGDYGAGQPWDFRQLAQLLDAGLTVPRLRISSIEPNLLSDEIIDFVAQSQRFMPHFHIPLQSGSNTILASMRRRYRRELYADRVAHITARMPHAAIGCDVITGFPGETDALFEETFEFLHGLEVTYLHVFPFSERTDTLAADMPGEVPVAVREARGERLRMLSEKKRHAFYNRHVGQTRAILTEQKLEDGYRTALTDNYIRVLVPPTLPGNTLLPATLHELSATGQHLVGEVTSVLA
ncbi:MAG: tRNA (N(6)-L-threonylcarbamoyladenosine(37)-C(2))-methylthiotransferase MtaB [Bacteroidetes bacterium]|nr:tRNA (N(6)-L-threonylcarbamoyladenosine(37)-C(2))-methylthiotransferase MtaB [Bacteroidota bacterium]